MYKQSVIPLCCLEIFGAWCCVYAPYELPSFIHKYTILDFSPRVKPIKLWRADYYNYV